VVFVLSASVAVAWAARKYVVTSPRFGAKTILVEGNQRRRPDEVAGLAGIAVGQNLFSLDEKQSERALLRDPWIEKVTISRTLPSTVRILVQEREARALAELGGTLYLTTRDGEPFKPLEPGDPHDLPVVSGVDPKLLTRDRVGAAQLVKRALDLVEELERSGLAKRWPVQEVHVAKDTSLVVTIGKEGIQLHMGHAPFREKIEQARAVLAELGRRKADASVVFLDNDAHPERVVVRLR
jgi:cell division protein FtsQ